MDLNRSDNNITIYPEGSSVKDHVFFILAFQANKDFSGLAPDDIIKKVAIIHNRMSWK